MFSFCAAALLFRASVRSCSLASLLDARERTLRGFDYLTDLRLLVVGQLELLVDAGLVKAWSTCAGKPI